MSNGFTDEELESLSDAEREAILDGEDDAADASEDDTDPDVDALAAGDDDGVDAAPSASEQDDFTPRLVAEPVADADAQLSAFETRKADLRAKLNEGDIGLDEYTEQHDAISKEERDLERRVWQADETQRQNDQADAQRWKWDQEQFFAAEVNAIYKDKYVLSALDVAIKDLANDPANASKKGGWFLAEADKMIRERFGAAKSSNNTAGKPRVHIPPTLGGMPAAELPETGGGNEFAHLDKLDQFALEAALARMTPEQEERYLQGV